MKEVLLLLSPRWKQFRNRLRNPQEERLRVPFILALVVTLWVAIYLIFAKALKYFTAEEMFGTIAATKLLSMILMTFAFVLIISNVITTFSSFFLSEDLELILAGPVRISSVYAARFLETMGDSSWMVLVFGLPVFAAYGKVFSMPLSFYGVSLVGFACLLVLVSSLAIFFIQLLVRTFPIRRLRDVFVFIGLLIFVGLYLLFRMIRPEEFLNPEGFASVVDYVSIMSETSSPLLPTTWMVEALRPYLTGFGHEQIWFYLALLVTAAVGSFRLVGHYHEAFHFDGYSNALESKGARLSRSRLMGLYTRTLERLLSQSSARLVVKETILMARDWGRLGQVLLLGALIVVYLYNFSVLPTLENPLATLALKSAIAFVNIGLSGFVMASLGVRFLFPAMSYEGRAFWILKSCPVELRRIFWVKYFFYLIPMLSLGLFLVVMTNRVLGLGTIMFVVSTVTVGFLTVGITSLSLGMGVIHADFKEVDPNRAVTGFGGLMTMIYAGLAVAGVIVLESFPVYRIITSAYFNHPIHHSEYLLIGSCFVAAFALALYLIIYPVRMGLSRINELEI